MDASGNDIPNQVSAIPLMLRRVGLNRRWVPVKVIDPFRGSGIVELSCDVDAFVDLEANRRGIHVSRIGDLLARLALDTYSSLSHYADRLHELLRIAQESATAAVSVRGVLTYREEVSGVKEKASLEHLELSASVQTNGAAVTRSESVGFTHITACPCVQETYRHSLPPENETLHQVLAESRMPLLTHSQRCRTRVTVSGAERSLSLSPLLAAIDQVVVRSQNTLPREFELLNVHRAYRKPQFLEDVLRELMQAMHNLLGRDHPNATVRIHSSSMESIHDFDLEGEIEFAVSELDAILANR